MKLRKFLSTITFGLVAAPAVAETFSREKTLDGLIKQRIAAKPVREVYHIKSPASSPQLKWLMAMQKRLNEWPVDLIEKIVTSHFISPDFTTSMTWNVFPKTETDPLRISVQQKNLTGIWDHIDGHWTLISFTDDTTIMLKKPVFGEIPPGLYIVQYEVPGGLGYGCTPSMGLERALNVARERAKQLGCAVRVVGIGPEKGYRADISVS